MRLGPREKNGSFRKAYANEYAPELPLPVLCLCSQPQLPPASAGNPPTLTDRSGPISYVVQLLSHVQLLVTPWTAACQASLSFTISWSLPKPMSTESMMPSNHLVFRCPLLLLPQSFPASGSFPNESAHRIRWTKYWSFSFSISPSNEDSGLISFRIDWHDLLAVQGTLKTLLQQDS